MSMQAKAPGMAVDAGHHRLTKVVRLWARIENLRLTDAGMGRPSVAGTAGSETRAERRTGVPSEPRARVRGHMLRFGRTGLTPETMVCR